MEFLGSGDDTAMGVVDRAYVVEDIVPVSIDDK
jgi:hypothetical protein